MRLLSTNRSIAIILLICTFSHITVSEKSFTRSYGKLDTLKILNEPSLIIPPHGFCQGNKWSNLTYLTYSHSNILNMSEHSFECLPSLKELTIYRCGSFPLFGGLFSALSTLHILILNRKYISLSF